jgi:DNA-binding NtrC family response regulator
VIDVQLPDKSGLELLLEIRKSDPKLPVIFITAGGTSATAIDAMKLGAFDYLLKPLNLTQMRDLVVRAIEVRRLMHEPIAIREEIGPAGAAGDALVGHCDAMQEVYKAIGRVAPQNVTVLIRGESGSGKELVARAIYQHSNRADGRFLAVNCAAIPETLLESELFGHERGAFTGADRRRIGKFEQCSGGTLFLDEIGDMPLSLQSKMQRVLQDQRFERVGGNETIQTDVRIIAATHRNLEQMAAENRFRSDLYYRLNVYSIELPPLRERMEDLPLLVNHFLAWANQELGREVKSVAPEAMSLLQRYSWPGNVRELQSVLKQAVLKSSGGVLLPDFLPEVIRSHSPSLGETSPATPPPARQQPQSWPACEQFIDERIAAGSRSIYADTVTLAERNVIARVLRHTDGNQAQAARLLGITRSTLRAKIRDLGITIARVIDAPGS